MKANQWAGLVTNASPYALPSGATVRQVNMTCRSPGQIETRGGMLPVRFVEGASDILDSYPYTYGGKSYLVSLLADGTLVALESPAYGAPATATPPTLNSAAGVVRTSYALDYIDGDSGDAPPPPPPPPPPLVFTGVIDGNGPWEFALDANEVCAGTGKLDEVDGGSATTATFPPAVPLSALCDYTE